MIVWLFYLCSFVLFPSFVFVTLTTLEDMIILILTLLTILVLVLSYSQEMENFTWIAILINSYYLIATIMTRDLILKIVVSYHGLRISFPSQDFTVFSNQDMMERSIGIIRSDIVKRCWNFTSIYKRTAMNVIADMIIGFLYSCLSLTTMNKPTICLLQMCIVLLIILNLLTFSERRNLLVKRHLYMDRIFQSMKSISSPPDMEIGALISIVNFYLYQKNEDLSFIWDIDNSIHQDHFLSWTESREIPFLDLSGTMKSISLMNQKERDKFIGNCIGCWELYFEKYGLFKPAISECRSLILSYCSSFYRLDTFLLELTTSRPKKVYNVNRKNGYKPKPRLFTIGAEVHSL